MTDTEKKSVSRHRLEVLIVDADFEWVNTALGNIKAAIVGTFGAVREKLVPRYLAEFECRFNRRCMLAKQDPSSRIRRLGNRTQFNRASAR
jgi:ISXO2 transposase-like protein